MTSVEKLQPNKLTSQKILLGDVAIHYLQQGALGEPVFMLHGFPEYSGAWLPYLNDLSRDFFGVAPDMRGYFPSSQPKEVRDYQVLKVALDIVQLAKKLGFNSINLVGHDWGGVVSWYLAALYPNLIRRLVILNAPHPLIYRDLYDTDPEQKQMAAYIEVLISEQGERIICQDNFKWLRSAFGHSAPLTFSDEAWDGYLNTWKHGLQGPISYYKANIGKEIQDAEKLRNISVPTLVLWGEKDRALSIKNLDHLDDFVKDLQVKRFSHASHFINHEMTGLVLDEIRRFFAIEKAPHLRN